MELAMRLEQVMQKIETIREEKPSSRLLEEIQDIREQISCNEGWFAVELDEDLIEACVYQGKALEARYRYLLRKARQEQVRTVI